MLKSLRYLLAASVALTVAVPVSAAAADPPAPRLDAVDADVAAAGVTITLVTGDRVHLSTQADGRAAVAVEPRAGADGSAPAFHEHEVDGHVYVVPADVAALVPQRLDWSLFDVTLLAERGDDDVSADAVPIVVDAAAGTAAPAALPAAVVTGTSGSTTTMAVTKADAATLGSALAAAAAGGSSAASVLDGIEQIRLDGVSPGTSGPTTATSSGAEMVNLTVEGIARDGRPAAGISSVDVINVDDQSLYLQIGVPFTDGTARFSVPAGHYAVLGYLFTYDEPHVYAYEGVATFEPEVLVESDTTVLLDARDSVPVEIEKPDPSEPLTTTLCYWRLDAAGASYSHSFTLSNPINTVFANPTEAISTGDFEFYSQHSLVAPDITASVVEPEASPIAADYVFSSAKLDGTFEHEMVYAGLGRVEDFEGIDVEGKIALIQRGEITFLEKMQNAQAAGAVVAMIFNNVPGLLLISGDPALLPTLAMSQAEGQRLLELTEAGTVIVGLDAVAVSPYLYDLVLPEPDQIPATLEYVVDDSTVATGVLQYRSHVPDHQVGELRHKWRPWEQVSFGFLRQTVAPLKRVEYISAGDTAYQQYHWASSTLELPFDLPMFGTYGTYDPGEQFLEKWMKQAVAPALKPPSAEPIESAAYRIGDSFELDIPEFVDRGVHWGPSQLPYDTTSFRLYEGEELLASTERAVGSFPVGPGPSTYRLELDVAREAPGWIYSPFTTTVWTVVSETASQPETLPLLDVQLRLRLDKLQHERPVKPGRVRWLVTHQAGSAASPIVGSQLVVSFDGGANWVDVEVDDRGDGHFSAQLPEPPAGATTVSVQVSATDDAGAAVWQEIRDAYALE